ncbi:MAG: hypothetical protein RBT81_10165 [Gammaproteobacteria bacterium]|jgi:hypothetical protein|nr:hypothetical protein [Gammaproteobacteria bacterium]
MKSGRVHGCLRAVGCLAFALAAAGLHAAPAESVYPEMLGEVCGDLHGELRHVSATATPSLEGKELLLQEAERLHLPHETRQMLTERLLNNAFSIAESELWAPFESFDLTLQARSAEAGALKARFSAQRYREYAQRLTDLPSERQDAIRRAALTVLAESGHLPDVLAADSERVRFVYREACLVNDAPGLMTTFIQGRMRELDLTTGALGPTMPLKPEMARLSNPALAFTSSGAAVVQMRAEQIEQALSTPPAQSLLQTIHGEILDILPDAERTRTRLLELVDLFSNAYGIEPVRVDFNTGLHGNGGSGYYFHSSRTYIFHYARFLEKLDRFIDREGLDLAVPADRARASAYMLGELVNNAAHELAHAGQYQWMDRWGMDAEVPEALRARVVDYRKNHRYKNTAWESHALIGIIGEEDYDRYRYQPIEEDAWAIGSHAETLALRLIEAGGPPAGSAQEPPSPGSTTSVALRPVTR